MRMTDDRLILALDGLDLERALQLTSWLGKYAYAVKVHDLVDSEGGGVIGKLKRAGAKRVFGDYKLLDIPKTVGRRAKALKKHGADIITIHAQGGPDMIAAAAASGAEIWTITVLTSLVPEQVEGNYGRTPEDAVKYFAGIAAAAGAAGFVCSPLEVGSLAHIDQRFKRVVPGTRSVGVAAGDQKRVATPLEALQGGAHHLVIASQVVEAANPVKAWVDLVTEINPT